MMRSPSPSGVTPEAVRSTAAAVAAQLHTPSTVAAHPSSRSRNPRYGISSCLQSSTSNRSRRGEARALPVTSSLPAGSCWACATHDRPLWGSGISAAHLSFGWHHHYDGGLGRRRTATIIIADCAPTTSRMHLLIHAQARGIAPLAVKPCTCDHHISNTAFGYVDSWAHGVKHACWERSMHTHGAHLTSIAILGSQHRCVQRQLQARHVLDACTNMHSHCSWISLTHLCTLFGAHALPVSLPWRRIACRQSCIMSTRTYTSTSTTGTVPSNFDFDCTCSNSLETNLNLRCKRIRIIFRDSLGVDVDV